MLENLIQVISHPLPLRKAQYERALTNKSSEKNFGNNRTVPSCEYSTSRLEKKILIVAIKISDRPVLVECVLKFILIHG